MDWIGVGRAFAQVLKHKRATQGASTLTMQLAKITYNHRERNLHSKLTEVALAKRIEATYTKDEILETYINRIFWGHTFLGIAAAARGYYDKEPRDLSLAECATLAGIIYGPNDFPPSNIRRKQKSARYCPWPAEKRRQDYGSAVSGGPGGAYRHPDAPVPV